jgi:hypothetical protein
MTKTIVHAGIAVFVWLLFALPVLLAVFFWLLLVHV